MPIVECLLVALFIMILNLCCLTWIYYLKSKAEWRELRAVRMVLAPEIVEAISDNKKKNNVHEGVQFVDTEEGGDVDFQFVQ